MNAVQNLVSRKINALARFLNSLAAIKRSYGTIQINKSINVGGGVPSSSISPVQQYPIPVYTKTIRVNTSFNNGNSIGSSSAASAASAAAATAIAVDVKDNEIRYDVNVDGNVTPSSRYYRQARQQYYYDPRLY